jgi:hypothetical protein
VQTLSVNPNAMLAPAIPDNVREQFRGSFDRTPFLFEHQLATHPLFGLDALRALAFRMAAFPGRVYHDSGDVRVSQKWGRIPVRTSLEEALDQLPVADAWIILKSANLDPEYTSILDTCMEQVSDLTGRDLNREIGKRVMSVLISSPRRITPYHIDGECNFLLQSQGSKTIYVFDGNDRSILTEQELERFWTADKTAAHYREASQEKARGFSLTPGVGVHVPLLHPHWVQNGSEVSVSISINFEFANKRMPDLYRANYCLRKLGIKPGTPGNAPLLDTAKLCAFRTFDAMRRLRKLKSAH